MIDICEIKYSDLITLYSTANVFKENYFETYKKIFKVCSDRNYLSLIVVNFSFSMELYLKWIYAYDYWNANEKCKSKSLWNNKTQFYKGHNLEYLFNCLPNKYKIDFEELLLAEGVSLQVFVDFLSCHKDDFVDWRYLFEKENILETNAKLMNISLSLVSSYVDKLRLYYCPKAEWVEATPRHGMEIPIEDINNKK